MKFQSPLLWGANKNPGGSRTAHIESGFQSPLLWGANKTNVLIHAINVGEVFYDGLKRTPSLSYRVCVSPDPHALTAQAGFRVFAFAFGGEDPPPGVTRIGKKGCVMRWRWNEVASPIAAVMTEPLRPSHPVNPLDLSRQGSLVSYQPVALPPHLLYQLAELKNEPMVRFETDTVHVPARVLQRAGVTGFR